MNREDINIGYYVAQRKAYEVLLNYTDGKLPINPYEIVNKIKNLKLMTFTEFAKELQQKQKELSLEEIKCQFESDRGFLKKKGKKQYILVYNEYDPDYIIKWTIFHELGHYFLGHLEEDDEQKYLFCDGEQYKEVQEKEANCFARHCSSPLTIALYMCSRINNTSLRLSDLFKYFFDMSAEVSEYCSNHFNTHWKYYVVKENDSLISLYKNSINEKINNVYNHFEHINLFGGDVWLYLSK